MLKMEDTTEIVLPIGSKILTAQVQKGNPCIWALVDDEVTTPQTRRFRIAGTGHPIKKESDLEYISTFQMYGGDLVFHVFEIM
jgi:hypothetical protein